MPDENSCQERVIINVRNGKFETFLSTLEYFPNTLLGCKERRVGHKNETTGEYHFDVNADVFDSILFFYQSKGILAKPGLVDHNLFWEALIYFELGREIKKVTEIPAAKWKRAIWQTLVQPELSITGKSIAFMALIILASSVAIFCAETMFIKDPNAEIKLDGWFYSEVFVNTFFTLDYLFHLIAAPSAYRYFKSAFGFVDLGCIMPFYMALLLMNVRNTLPGMRALKFVRLLRLLKVLRIFKVMRYSKTIRNQVAVMYRLQSHMIVLLFVFLMTIVFFSALIEAIENPVNPMFSSFSDTVWFVVVTMTTVGYGDMVSITPLGKVITVISIIGGQCLIFYFFLPVYAAVFKEYFDDRDKDMHELIPLDDLKSLFKVDAADERESSDTLTEYFEVEDKNLP